MSGRERLTERVGDGVRYDNGEYIITCYPKNNNLTTVDKLAAKLCDLEDKIENGTLIAPLFTLGQTVYSIEDGIKCILVGKVYEIVSNEFGTVYRSSRKGYFGFSFTYHAIGRTVFFTPEDAERALAERNKK